MGGIGLEIAGITMDKCRTSHNAETMQFFLVQLIVALSPILQVVVLTLDSQNC